MAKKGTTGELNEAFLPLENREPTTGEVKQAFLPHENRGKTKDKTKLVVLAGSVVLNVFLIALIIITAMYMAGESVSLRGDSALCINCSFIKLHPEDDLSAFSVYEDNTCCLRNGGNYSQMVDKLVEGKLKKQLLSDSKPYQPLHCDGDNGNKVPVIKMVGRWVNLPHPSSSRFPWLRWDVAVHRSDPDMKGQLTQDDTHITVGSTGIYQIYSQLVLQNTQPEELSSYSESPNKYYMHAIYKQTSSGHDERILGGSYTYYQNKDGDTMTTSYIGSPYQLRKGDRIGVKVHDVSQVVASNLTNFFGMHLIQ